MAKKTTSPLSGWGKKILNDYKSIGSNCSIEDLFAKFLESHPRAKRKSFDQHLENLEEQDLLVVEKNTVFDGPNYHQIAA